MATEERIQHILTPIRNIFHILFLVYKYQYQANREYINDTLIVAGGRRKQREAVRRPARANKSERRGWANKLVFVRGRTTSACNNKTHTQTQSYYPKSICCIWNVYSIYALPTRSISKINTYRSPHNKMGLSLSRPNPTPNPQILSVKTAYRRDENI